MKYFLVAVLTASLAGAAFASHHEHKEKEHNGAVRMQKMIQKLELNENQAAAMKELHEKYLADMQALRDQHRQDMSKILNAEQMKKFQEMQNKHHDPMD